MGGGGISSAPCKIGGVQVCRQEHAVLYSDAWVSNLSVTNAAWLRDDLVLQLENPKRDASRTL